uniref:hypothetical protein n=1 Tax=Alloprevotella sp. TaxID=1872471 RepID=UPI0040295B46
MKLRTIIYLLSCLLWTACSDDELQPATADEATTVPITLTLGQRATRSAPPGGTDPMNPTVDGEAETEQTNTVRIIAFRCKETQENEENVSYSNDENYADSDFVYDPTNDQTVTCSRATTSAHRLTAHGQLKKMKGYAYRVVALAYSLTRSLPFSNHLLADVGEENLFTLNLAAHTTLDQFEADLTHVAHDSWTEFRNGTDKTTVHNPAIHNTRSLSGQLCYAPQLFYGQCTSVNGNKVIHFHEKNAADSISSTYPLSGVLYRGMAKVQLTLTIDKLNKSGTLQWIGLLANETRTSVKLSAYDDFLQPFNPIHTTMKNGTYTLVGFVNTGLSVGSTVTLTAWLLPTATKLAIRTFIRNGLLLRYAYNYPIEVSELSSAETGTGIISPDVVDNTFYLRRNQRYQFKGKLSTLTSKTELE